MVVSRSSILAWLEFLKRFVHDPRTLPVVTGSFRFRKSFGDVVKRLYLLTEQTFAESEDGEESQGQS